jgi:hypothetical protein
MMRLISVPSESTTKRVWRQASLTPYRADDDVATYYGAPKLVCQIGDSEALRLSSQGAAAGNGSLERILVKNPDPAQRPNGHPDLQTPTTPYQNRSG